ncbi:MAG: hypothetical protein NC418_11305, partial [Muribaculaceae bacterium]|nr:hypothetical protein [Muribaculaceae bacterium]
GLTRGAMFNESNVYAASGLRLSSIRTIRQGNNRLIAANRRYVGPFTFNADTLERVDFPGGYFDGAGKAHFMLTDWQGNVNMVVDAEGRLEQHVTYYPYGEPHREPAGQRHLFAAKERGDFITSAYDFGPRRLFSPICLWGAPDLLASETPWLSPYTYCAGNPIRYTDPTGMLLSIAPGDGYTYRWIKQNEEWGFYNYENQLYSGDSEFYNSVTTTLNTIMKGGSTGYDLVSVLADSPYPVTIYPGESSTTSPSGNITWNVDGAKLPTTSGILQNPAIDLAHELSHAYFNWHIGNATIWFSLETKDGIRDVYSSDIFTTHIENKIRAEQGLPLRTHYSINYNNEPLEMSRILDTKRRASVYYNIFEKQRVNELPIIPYIY